MEGEVLAMGETSGHPGVEGELVAVLLMMPTTRWVRPTFKFTMNDASGQDGAAPKSYDERIKSVYDTSDLGTIMGRFYNAVSWRTD